MVIERVMSLGKTCDTRYQIARVFEPLGVEVLGGPFDWQITPPQAVVDYFRNGFAGMFERDDLSLIEGAPATGKFAPVRNTRYRTSHLHEFRIGADLDSQYADARARHDHLCAKVISGLADGRPTLFVVRGTLDRAVLADMLREIEVLKLAWHQLLWVDPKRLAPSLPPPKDWQGNDDFWSRALAEAQANPDSKVVIYRPGILEVAAYQGKRLARHLASGRF